MTFLGNEELDLHRYSKPELLDLKRSTAIANLKQFVIWAKMTGLGAMFSIKIRLFFLTNETKEVLS